MEVSNSQIPVLGFVAYNGVGKTTLLLKLLPLLCERGLCVGMIKHVHHQFDVDKPGKDSFELRKAGAQQMLVTSNQRWALIVEREFEHEPRLEDHIAHLDLATLDLILIEGFTQSRFPKIELHRPALGKPLMFTDDKNIVAVASDSPLILPDHIELLDLNDEKQIARFICERFLSQVFNAQSQR
ncbi:MAG: molybdopterin-guanine dinucleotide biosynthesis protein B [Gammaproteobacteria bacterium]|nr:molybdopterin-guanine dinucleotide biosynthesis protein B [Gammaproteobacteria bacterium]